MSSRRSRGVETVDNQENSDPLSSGLAPAAGETLEHHVGAMLTMRVYRRESRCDCGRQDCTGATFHILTAVSSGAEVPLRRGAPHAYEASMILTTVAYAFGLSVEAMIGKQRREEVVAARVCYITKVHDLLGFTWVEIGRTLRRDHSTIIHAYKRRDYYQDRFRLEWDSIDATLTADPEAAGE